MDRIPGRSDRRSRVEQQAAEWLAKHDRGLTAEEQDRFFGWLANDPLHGDAFSDLRRTVIALRALGQWRPEHGTRPNPDLLAQPSPWSRRFRSALPIALAAAAGIALLAAVGGAWHARQSSTAMAALEPRPGAVRKLLEDGSTIDLSRASEVEIGFTASERRVHLVRGEAHFTVAKNPARPFVVRVGNADVRAVGTAFDVRLRSDAMEVLVTEGTVAVAPSDIVSAETAVAVPPETYVEAGYRTRVALGPKWQVPTVVRMAPAEKQRSVPGAVRELEFSDAPLAQVVAEFNRDSRIKMVVADPQLATLPIGATLRSDNIEGFVRLLQKSFNVAVERRNGMIILRHKS